MTAVKINGYAVSLCLDPSCPLSVTRRARPSARPTPSGSVRPAVPLRVSPWKTSSPQSSWSSKSRWRRLKWEPVNFSNWPLVSIFQDEHSSSKESKSWYNFPSFKWTLKTSSSFLGSTATTTVASVTATLVASSGVQSSGSTSSVSSAASSATAAAAAAEADRRPSWRLKTDNSADKNKVGKKGKVCSRKGILYIIDLKSYSWRDFLYCFLNIIWQERPKKAGSLRIELPLSLPLPLCYK